MPGAPTTNQTDEGNEGYSQVGGYSTPEGGVGYAAGGQSTNPEPYDDGQASVIPVLILGELVGGAITTYAVGEGLITGGIKLAIDGTAMAAEIGHGLWEFGQSILDGASSSSDPTPSADTGSSASGDQGSGDQSTSDQDNENQSNQGSGDDQSNQDQGSGDQGNQGSNDQGSGYSGSDNTGSGDPGTGESGDTGNDE